MRDSARRYISAEQLFENRHKRLAEPLQESWRQLADLGWLALAVPEVWGGLGSGVEDLAIVAEEMGRGLCVEPFIGCAVLPAGILSRCSNAAAKELELAGIAGEAACIAVALYEKGSRYDLRFPVTLARRMGDGSYRLSGSKILVSGGADADKLIVSARIEQNGSGQDGLALFLLDARLAGIQQHAYRTIDDGSVADFTFEDVALPADALLEGSEGALACLEDAIDEAILCLCADALGGMEKVMELTCEYLKIRTQFGRPLADFQALQHSMAEMFIETSDARSMLHRAIASFSAPGDERRKAVSACKVKLMESAKSVAGTAVHLHGGIGVTGEYPVGHYLRRVIVSERIFGDNAYHMERFLGK
nr:acyl-CoA dehydrogenase family protein [Noviherbaspirillum sedimenti]